MFATSVPRIAPMWRAVKRYVSIVDTRSHPTRLERRIRRAREWKQLESESRRLQNLSFGDPQDACKFLGLGFWLRENIRRSFHAHLHDRPPLKILDLGCGSGVFVFVCRCLGHDASG